MLLKHLDIAVQAATEQGANQSAVYDSVLHEKAIRRQAIARYLQTALEKNELEVRYRPTYNLKGNALQEQILICGSLSGHRPCRCC